MPSTLLMLTALATLAPGDDSLRARILERIGQVPGAEVSVAYQELTRPADTLFLRADTAYHAASTMKVPVMIEAFRQSDAGTLPLDRADTLWNRFASIVDGSPYSLDAAEDSDSTVYLRVGQPVAMRELIERMITHSSNLATNAVIDRVTAPAVQRTTNALGATGMTVLRGVEDQKAYERGLSNTTTARALATLMAAIERGQAAGPASTDSMRAILLRQAFNDEIPAGLPAGTRVAHKTGSITGILHDAAVVYPADGHPYVLVVLTGKIPNGAVATALIADISRLVHAHHLRRSAAEP